MKIDDSFNNTLNELLNISFNDIFNYKKIIN